MLSNIRRAQSSHLSLVKFFIAVSTFKYMLIGNARVKS